MGVYYAAGRGYRYDFRYRGKRHQSARGFPTRQEALDAEAELRRVLRRSAAGLETPGYGAPDQAPSIRIAEWAGVYLHHVRARKRLRDPDSVEYELRVVLRFWGATPSNPDEDREPKAPYHDLTLRDPIDDPAWLLKFEDWMAGRTRCGAARRNHFRTRMSQMYALAMSALYRLQTGITVNPFRGTGLREVAPQRTVTIELAQCEAIMRHAPHALLTAIAIGALAPKLRESNICRLCWSRKDAMRASAAPPSTKHKRRSKPAPLPTYLSPDQTQIIVEDHKTMARTGPMATLVSADLAQILDAARAAYPTSPYVLGARYTPRRIQGMLSDACTAADVTYGYATPLGITFHTIRHTAATLLAAQGVPDALRQRVMGHLTAQTTQRYTHLAALHERAPLELLATAMPIAALAIKGLQDPARGRRRRRRNGGPSAE